MDPLSVTASIIAILQLTVKVSEYLRDAKDASTNCSQFTIETSNLSKLLIDLLSHIDEHSNKPWHAKVRELGGKDGPIYQYRVALEQLKDKIADEHGIKKMAKTLLWKHVKEDAERILSKIERLKSLVQIALEIDHFKLSQAIESRMNVIHNDSKVTKVGIDALQQGQDRERHRFIMDWISSADFPAQQSDLIARRQEETGLWFLDSPTFAEWIRGSSPTLFCPGIPGAGKTMMAAITVDYLQNIVQTHDVGVAYIYCNYKGRADQTPSSLLAAVLKQLVQDRPSLAEPLSSLYDHHEVRKTRPSLDETLGALQSVLTNYLRVYVIIDALDECVHDVCEMLLSKLRNVQSKTDLRLMATSRFIPDVVEQFSGVPELEVGADAADVKRYVVGQTNRLPRCIQRDDDLQQLVLNKIVEAVPSRSSSCGFATRQGYGEKSPVHAESALRGHRSSQESIQRRDRENRRPATGKAERAKSVLSWLSYAQRQLTTNELCHALAVEPDDEELDHDNIPDIEELVSVCAGLVTVNKESNVVRLVHYTTQNYLEEIRDTWNPSAQYEIASTCLTYLCFDTFKSGSCQSDAEFDSRLERNPFLDYSARYWGHHVVTVQEKVSELAMCLLKDGNLVACAVQTLSSGSRYARYSELFPKQATGLHVAAYFGLVYMSRKLLSWIVGENVALTDSKDSWGQTPLLWAANEGHEAVVKVLAERDDVDADSKDWDGRTPLSWAAERGHEAVVRVLAERDDVDADSKDRDSRTPLSWAAERGHEAVVRVLAERDDVDADPKDSWGQTLLSWAAEGGHGAVAKVLELT